MIHSSAAELGIAHPVAPRGGRWFAKYGIGVVALALLVAICLVALCAEFVAPHSPYAEDSIPLSEPSAEHPFGTDRLGRDVLSRVIYGARISLPVAFIAVIAGTAIGLALGLVSGYLGGKLDGALRIASDLLLAFPGIVAVMAITAALGASLTIVTIAISALIIPIVMRVIRANVQRERESAYVEAARTLGASGGRVVFRHILPNVASTAVVLATQLLPMAILTEATLSFLGFGAQPPTASWGGDMSGDAQLYFTIQPWMAIAPGLALTVTVLAFNFLGDWLRDYLDPRTRVRV